jgi:hypothetical protein
VTLAVCRLVAAPLNRRLVNDAALLTALEAIARDALMQGMADDMTGEVERESEGWRR